MSDQKITVTLTMDQYDCLMHKAGQLAGLTMMLSAGGIAAFKDMHDDLQEGYTFTMQDLAWDIKEAVKAMQIHSSKENA